MSDPVRLPALRRDDRWAACSVWLLTLAVYTATLTGLPDVPDAEVEFQTTSALVRTGSADVGGTPEAEALVAAGFGLAAGAGDRAGRWYSRYGIGQAVVAIPLYCAGTALARLFPDIERRHAADTAYGAARSEYFAHLAVGARNALLTASTALLVVLTARRLGVGRSAAWCCGLSYGLCTFAWPQARSTLSDVQATFFLFLAFHGVVRARETIRCLGAPHPLNLLGIGACLAAAVLTRIAVLPAACALALVAGYVLWTGQRSLEGAVGAGDLPRGMRRPVQWLLAAAPFALGLVALALWNRARFGSALETGYGPGLDFSGFFAANPLHGLLGLLVSPGRGLLWMAPGLLLLPVCLQRERATGDVLWSRTLLLLAPAVVLPVAWMRGWHGAWTYGPRYLLPLLPFAWLGIGLVLERQLGCGRRTRGFAALLLGLGLVVQGAGALVDAATHLDLGLQAARTVWPTGAGVPEVEMDARRFERLQWDWRFAAPWAHLRILRHRAAGLGEDFSARELYFVDVPGTLRPEHARARGFAHLAWVDLHARLGGRPWPALLFCALSGILGVLAVLRAQRLGTGPT